MGTRLRLRAYGVANPAIASVAFAIPWLLAVLRLVGDDPEVRPRPAPAERPAPFGRAR